LKPLRTDLIVGARPNFVKAAPLYRALRAYPAEFDLRLVHTGQHYDFKMSDVFFADLGLPQPDVHLSAGSGEHGVQTGEIMIRYEREFMNDPAQLVLVLGDVNSTVACALVAVKRGAAVGHVEAGLRSYDRGMPEEINRVLTDRMSDFLFTPSADANENLLREGVPDTQIFLVGNIMIDSLVALLGDIDRSQSLAQVGLTPRTYVVVTLHRPSNVDDLGKLDGILATLATLPRHIQFVFPVHPRTRQMLAQLGSDSALAKLTNVRFMDPLGYKDFLKLVKESLFVITDSGGIQEESTYLDIPCLTMRDNTERPITLSEGTNVLVGRDPTRVLAEARKILAGEGKRGMRPALWDGCTAQRIVAVLQAYRRGDVRMRSWEPTGNPDDGQRRAS
jgi:UDP-N-acetylglucosamine 2-epimerase (non-hydrolysing)